MGSAAIVFAITDHTINALITKSPERARLDRHIEAQYDNTMTLCLSLGERSASNPEDLEVCSRWAEFSIKNIRKHRYNLKPLGDL